MTCINLQLECILQKIKEAIPISNACSKTEAEDAIKLLVSQHGLLRTPPYELRHKILNIFRAGFSSNNKLLIEWSASGTLALLKDNRFYVSDFDPVDDDEFWLTSQIVSMVSSAQRQNIDIFQNGIFRILTALNCIEPCHCKWTAKGITELCTIMIDLVEAKRRSPELTQKTEAVLCQSLKSFVRYLKFKSDSKIKEDNRSSWTESVNTFPANSFNEVIPIVQFLCFKINDIEESMVEETDNADIDSILSFILKLLNSLFSDLPQDVCKSRRFQTLIWQKLVPSLIGALQADSQFDASFETKIQLALHLLDRKESVRKKKLVFLVSLELIRIFGSIQHIRQVLESLLHRLLISALPEDRCETLKSLNSAFSSLEFVLPLCAPPFHDECSSTPSKDMGLFRLIVVCMEDACLVKDPEAIDVCVENIRNLLELLDQIIKIQDHNDKKEVSLPKEYVQVINETFATMSDSSYRGPSEYQAKVKYQRKTCSRSSTPISSTALTALSYPAPLSDSSSDETSEPQLPPRFVSEHHKESVNAFSALQDAARLFVKNLVDNNLCPFMNQRSIIHLDDQLQKFAYRSCKGLRDLEGFQMDVTGDDLYILASLSVYLNAVMEKALFFTDQVDSSYLMTEAGFVELAESWGLCALGSVFLGEVYQSTVENNWGILSSSSSLASFVHDIGIKGNGGCYLTVCDRLHQVGKPQERSPDADAAKKLARYILTSVWTQLVSILAIGMGSAPDQGIESVLGNTENLSPGTISGAIVSLHLLANLCCELELNEKCEAIFSLLVSSVFISPDDKIMERLKRRRKKKSYWPSHAPRKSNNALTYSQALSITVTLTTGLELASIEPGCWKHVLRCCSYISSLENERVSTSRTKELLGKTTPRLENLRRKFSSKPLNGQASEEEDECIDVYGFIKAATSRVTSSFEVDSLLQNARSNLVGFDSEVAEKALVSIASIAERMFEDAGTKLNLLSLVNFMKELCRASLHQLESVADDPKGSLFLLRKTEDVTLKVIRSRRPLLHVWRVWMIFSNHVLMVCHRFVGECTTVALTSLHLVINAILGEISESRLFRTNEKLFLPYEKLLKNPLISPLVLKQVLESIKDLISYHGIQEIKSGWNALFRILRLFPAQIESLDVVSETLEDCARTFLSLNDVYITADCLFEMINTLVWFFKDYFSSSTLPSLSGKYIIQLLEYFVRAHQSKILPSFRVTEPQSIFSRLCQVDFSVLNYKLVKFAESPDASAQFEDFIFHQSSSNALEFLANNSNLEDLSCHLEDPSNSTQLVLSLFLKLTESFVVFPSDQVVFTLIQGLWTLTKHNEYVLVSSSLRFCLLPTLQKTLQKDMSSQLSKQIATQTSELIVHMYAEKKDTEKQGQLSSHLPFLLRDFLIVMVGASASGQEAGMSIGISCFRHILQKGSPFFDTEDWNIICGTVFKLMEVTIFPLNQLCFAFSSGSDYYYGDTASVKITAKNEGDTNSATRLHHLTQQAFLVDNQFAPTANRGLQARAYTFLICKNNDYGGDTDVVLRIPFKTIVIAITAHHLVLNILAHWFRSSSPRQSEGSTRVEGLFTSNSTSRNPAKLSKSQLYLLLESVDLSFMSSLLFDSRPGLKFLVQKVACLDRAANCYKQIEMSWSSKFSLLIELVLHEVETVAEEDSVNAEEDDPLKNEFAKHLKHHLEKLIIFYKGAFSTIPSIAIGENIMRRYSVENKVSIESEFDGRIVATDESGMASNCSFDEKSWKEEDNYSSLTFRSCEYPNRRDDYSPSEKGQTKGTAKTARRHTCKERDETHDSVVDEERAQSLLKDRETRCCVANSMVASTLQTLGKLSKKDLKVLQPWLASTLGFLTEEVSSPMLRRGVAELLAAFNTVNTKN